MRATSQGSLCVLCRALSLSHFFLVLHCALVVAASRRRYGSPGSTRSHLRWHCRVLRRRPGPGGYSCGRTDDLQARHSRSRGRTDDLQALHPRSRGRTRQADPCTRRRPGLITPGFHSRGPRLGAQQGPRRGAQQCPRRGSSHEGLPIPGPGVIPTPPGPRELSAYSCPRVVPSRAGSRGRHTRPVGRPDGPRRGARSDPEQEVEEEEVRRCTCTGGRQSPGAARRGARAVPGCHRTRGERYEWSCREREDGVGNRDCRRVGSAVGHGSRPVEIDLKTSPGFSSLVAHLMSDGFWSHIPFFI